MGNSWTGLFSDREGYSRTKIIFTQVNNARGKNYRIIVGKDPLHVPGAMGGSESVWGDIEHVGHAGVHKLPYILKIFFKNLMRTTGL